MSKFTPNQEEAVMTGLQMILDAEDTSPKLRANAIHAAKKLGYEYQEETNTFRGVYV